MCAALRAADIYQTITMRALLLHTYNMNANYVLGMLARLNTVGAQAGSTPLVHQRVRRSSWRRLPNPRDLRARRRAG